MKRGTNLSVSVVIPIYNVESIVYEVLESVSKQDYPILEFILIDNHSTDNSIRVAEEFKRDHKNLKLQIIKRKKTYGLSSSYNLGAKRTKGNYVVTLHSDSTLPTKGELRKLIKPFLSDMSVVATYPILLHPKDVWLTYNFWQKCLFARSVETEIPSMNGKFDCYKKKTFLQIGGYDEKRFHHSMGTEDADMRFRLTKEGKIIPTEARVVHLHGADKNYSLSDWIARRKFLAISYGRFLRLHARDMKQEILAFLVKPLIALTTPILFLIHPMFLFLLLVFPFVYAPRLFMERSTFSDPRIIMLPFIIIFLIYYESFWMLKSLFFFRIKV